MKQIRRLSLFAGSLLAISTLVSCQSVLEKHPTQFADTIIKGGTIFDGTGAPGVVGDVVISGDIILFVGNSNHHSFQAGQTIDATDLVVAPGFIDPHTHAGGDLSAENVERRRNLPFAFQGVTTVIVGNDGNGSSNVTQQATKAQSQKIGTNVAFLAGFGYIRKTVIGDENRAPSTAELDRMKSMMVQAMCEGAMGFSAGLYYTPQNFAKTDEVIELAKIAGQYQGYYDTHLRDESTYNIGLQGAVNEALDIGRRANIPVHISHIKALGPAVWGHSSKIIDLVEKARFSGHKVTADQYPWSASGTRISNALVPRWALDGGLEGLRERLQDPVKVTKIKKEMAANLKRRGGATKLLITGSLGSANAEEGATLAEIAAHKMLNPLDTAIQILKTGDARVASFNMNEKDILAFADRDWVVTGSDGSTGHPRKYGSFPKAYRDFVANNKLLTVSQFVRRSSGRTADIVGLTDRGYLKKGMAADIVVFDRKIFAPKATYQNPREYSAGVDYLFVNGKAVIANGKPTEKLPGKPILKRANCN